MKFFKFLLVCIIFIGSAFNMDAKTPSDTQKPGVITGWVLDTLANQALEFATVTLKFESDSSLFTGAITDVNGFFKLKGIPHDNYYLEVSFLGYIPRTISDIQVTRKNSEIELGDIGMRPNEEMLDEVVVRADRPTMTYKIDKKVINVSELHTSAAGTAVEVLENIPSVTVSIEGDVSLRGSGSFTVLIDGKPTIMDAQDVLKQIPASQIENIEIITNPSAKFDPGGVGGIINIVMKKNRKDGINGIVNLNGGNQNTMGGDFLLNYRRERINYFLSGDYNQRGFVGKSVRNTETTNNMIDADPLTTFLYSDGTFNRDRDSWGFRGGFEFNINPFNTLSVSYRLNNRNYEMGTVRNYEEWTSINSNPSLEYSNEDGYRGGMAHSLNIDYQRDFDQEDHKLLTQLILETRDSDDFSYNMLTNDNNVAISGQESSETGPSNRITFIADYTLPINESNKFEAGLNSRVRLSDETNNMFQLNTQTNEFVLSDQFSKNVSYNRMIHAAYSTFSGEWNKIGYQVGTRLEYTDRLISLVGEDNQFTLNRWDWYPTLHLSYQLPSDQQVMASYTRRLQRIRGWYLEPFYTWSDAFNIRIGNPSLDPEYIDSYELSYQKRFEKNVVSVDMYYRVTNNKIQRVRGVYEDQENVILTTFANVGRDYSLGTEIMTGFDPFDWWHFDLMGNIFDYRQEGTLNGENFSTSSFNWNLRWNNDFKVTDRTRIQFRTMYNSPTVMAQGERSEFFVSSFSVRQDFLERALSVTLQVRDVFNTMQGEYIYEGPGFYSYLSWNPESPMITLTASFRINNYNDRRGRPRGGGMNDMEGGGDM